MAASMHKMWSRSLRSILNKCRAHTTVEHSKLRYLCTSSGQDEGAAQASRDPGPIFLQNEVQRILYKVTGFDLDKIFRVKPVKDVKEPAYKLMTDRQLQEAHEDALNLGKERQQMAPFMKARDEDSWELISDDAEIAGHDMVNVVFTDITFGVPERERLMVVREPSGVLRTATTAERDRLQRIYFPSEGRMHHTPSMFLQENLETMLSRGQYEYILDRACVQFDPDDPEFLRVTHRTYDHVDQAGLYEDLHSTRHFGGMTFYLTFYRKLDGLLMHEIEMDQIHDAGDLIRLYNIVHPDSATAKATTDNNISNDIELIKTYISNEATKSSQLELALQAFINAQSKTASSS